MDDPEGLDAVQRAANDDRFILFGLAAFALILPILAYLRGSPFHEVPRDSANRILMHIVPLVALSVILAAGTAVRASVGRETVERKTEFPSTVDA